MERLLGFDAQLLFDSAVTGINIFILFFALSYFLFQPVKDFLEKRKKRIEEELLIASNAKHEAQMMKEQYDTSLKEADKKAEEVIGQAMKHAEKRQEELLEQARVQADELLKKAQIQIEEQWNQVQDRMREEIALAATNMAMEVVSNMMDQASYEAVMHRVVKEIGEMSWQG